MSVCDWGDCSGCPCLITYYVETVVLGAKCRLGMFSDLAPELPVGERFYHLRGGRFPDSCPHAAALRAVLDDPTLVLVAVPKGYRTFDDGYGWERIQYRREERHES